MSELWMPDAIKIPGHPDKVGYPSGTRGPQIGTVVHSAEGWRTELKRLVQDVNRRASWCFSVLTDGTIWQHYPVDAWLWHSGDTDDDGGVRGNMELGSIEEEGVAGTQINDKQVAATVRVIQFQSAYFERDTSYARYPVMPANGWTLAEHNQISNRYTACPSDRIPWDDVLAGLEDDMTFIGVACDKATLNTPQFESFKLYVSSTGLVRHKLTSKGEREGLEAAGYNLIKMTRAELEQYKLA